MITSGWACRAILLATRVRHVEARVHRTPSRRRAAALLALSVAFEVVGALALAHPSAGALTVLGFGGVSLLLLAAASRTLPVYFAYGTWAGGSTALVALVDTATHRRVPDTATAVGLGLLVLGSALLHAGGSARGRRPRRP